MRRLKDDVALIASPGVPLGYIGISHEYSEQGVNAGEFVPFDASGMKRLQIQWVSSADETRAIALAGTKWVCLNPSMQVDFKHHIDDEPVKAPTTGTVDGVLPDGTALDFKTAAPPSLTGRKATESQPNMQQMEMPADVKASLGAAVHRALEKKYSKPASAGEALKHEITHSMTLPASLVNPDAEKVEPHYTVIDGKPVVVCVSLEMDPDVFPDYAVRMADRTRQALGISWDTPWRLGGRLFKIKPALQGDLDAIRYTPYAPVAVFIHANSIPPGVRAVRLFEPKPNPHDGIARVYLETRIGQELMKDVDVEIVKIGSKIAARVYYKMFAAGVSEGPTIQDAIDEAIKAGLRSDLVSARNRIDATISKLDND